MPKQLTSLCRGNHPIRKQHEHDDQERELRVILHLATLRLMFMKWSFALTQAICQHFQP